MLLCRDTDEGENSSSQNSDELVPLLLSRLHSPTPSVLARKRQVRSNLLPKGVSTMAPKSVSPQDRVKAYPNEKRTVGNNKLFCTACWEEVTVKRVS